MRNSSTVDPELRPVLQHLRADARRGGSQRVGVLGLAVDGEQPRVAAHLAYDDLVRSSSDDPEVEVGQPAGQLLDVPRPPRQAGEAVEVGVGQEILSSKAATTSGSIVCFGPVNQCFTETCQ